MLSEAQRFWDAIVGKVKQTVREESKNAFRCERYTVTTAPNGVKMGVTLPMGNTELMLPYSSEVASATVGDTVLVVWWGSMSNAKVYYYANGYNGSQGIKVGTIAIPLNWSSSGSGYYTATPTVAGAEIAGSSKVDIQPNASTIIQLQNDGVGALYVENNSGVLTAYAVGAAPSAVLTMQCTVSEVSS